MTTPATTAAIDRRVDLAASPERVWTALTDPAEIASWFTQRAEFALEVGAEGWMEWREHGRFAIRIEAVDRPRYFAWRGARDPDTGVDDGPSTLVEWWLEPLPGGGTSLRLRESGFEQPDERRLNTMGWLHSFGALAAHIATEPWQGGIRRTYRLQSPADAVWKALAEPAELRAWWGGVGELEVRPGFEGWFDWPSEGGRFAMRFDAVEPPAYIAWRWVPALDVPLADASQVLRTEWVVMPRDDGGTDLHLFESGFTGPDDHRLNDGGWDSDVIPALRRHLREPEAG